MAAARIPDAHVPIARTDADWAFDIHFPEEDWTGSEVRVAFARQGLPADVFEVEVQPTEDLSCPLRIPAAIWAEHSSGTYSVEVRKIDGEAIDDAAVFKVYLHQGLSDLGEGKSAPQPVGDGTATGGVIVSRSTRVEIIRAAGVQGPAGPAGADGEDGHTPTDQELGALIEPVVQQQVDASYSALLLRIRALEETDPTGADLIFAHSPWRLPGQSSLLSPSASQLTEVRDLWCPALAAGSRLVFVNWQKATTNGGGTLTPSSSNTLDYVALFSGSAGSGYVRTLTFGGAKAATMAAGGFAISDPLPADFAGGHLRLSISTPSGGQRPRGWTTRLANAPSHFSGEFGRVFASAQPALETAGAINSASGGANSATDGGYTPAFILTPAGTTKSLLGLGDSRMWGQGEDQRIFADARGNLGAFERGLDSATNGRIAMGNFAVRGARAAALAVNFGSELALLRHIADTYNGGRWPFHGLLSAMLVNDFTTLGDTATEEAMWSALTDWAAWMAETFPGVPVMQATVATCITPTSDPTSYAGQTPRDLSCGALLETFNQRLVATPPTGVALPLDLRAAQYVVQAGVPKVPLTPFTAAGGATLATGIAAGYNLSGGVVIDCPNGPPAVGDYMVFDPGQANQDRPGSAISQVTLVSGTQYSIRTAVSVTTNAYAHAAGSVLRTSAYLDTTHWGSTLSETIGALLDAKKPGMAAKMVY